MNLLKWTSWQHHKNSTGRGWYRRLSTHSLDNTEHPLHICKTGAAIPVTSSELRPWPDTDVPTIGSQEHQAKLFWQLVRQTISLTALSPTSRCARHKSSSRLWKNLYRRPYSAARRWQSKAAAASHAHMHPVCGISVNNGAAFGHLPRCFWSVMPCFHHSKQNSSP